MNQSNDQILNSFRYSMSFLSTIHFIHLQNVPIFEQLQLEEALLRTESRNFCIVNHGSPRAIVMGISGQTESLLDQEKVQKDQIPVIRRFSGGGTVIVDEETLFITFIFSKDAIEVTPFPESIFRWSEDLYVKAWGIPGFALRENDYVIQDKKCGGNAQYIKKDRWLHHTSFLWNYRKENMKYLLLPAKRPKYREDRDHHEFLCSLKEHSSHTAADFFSLLQKELVKRFYIEPFDVQNWIHTPHRQTVKKIG